MAKNPPPYPAEFRLEAVRLLRTGRRSAVQLAAELGCCEDTIRARRTSPTATVVRRVSPSSAARASSLNAINRGLRGPDMTASRAVIRHHTPATPRSVNPSATSGDQY